ncbi:MAG: cytochrome c oxidase subunit 3 [Pseudomonadales bacterium]|nr:cytochrome c oxidase subunit 3 [Pseudomonadales bacterium]
MSTEQQYYIPEPSKWPLVAAASMFVTLTGLGLLLFNMTAGNDSMSGQLMFGLGLVGMAYMFFGWFGKVIEESMGGLYSNQLSVSFRKGMSWFIFSEVMFFAAFFGVLFYVRLFSVPWLSGEGAKGIAHMLWPDFSATWPLLTNPSPEQFGSPKAVIDPWHIPLINTFLLVTSSVTLTLAHHALKAGKRSLTKIYMAITMLLGFTFLALQIYEYIEAYQHLNLTLSTGIYGSTFFMLTGFHGAHVTIGCIMLTTVFIRILKGHFTADDHFAFEASAWYWHFVDVVWLMLFMLVYVF